MSKEIDEKVVEMRFDNKQFEQNVSTTMFTLEKLKKSLQLKDSAKAFEDIDSAAKKVDFSGLGQAVESVKVKFSALQVMAITALQNITNSAINAGKNLVKSLSIDQIQAGWDKYADKTSAVQTIMAATSKDFSDTGEQMEYVNGQLEKLNWFTDETSYSFLDMVNNIGKFTSNGVKLDDAVTSMEGISTWAAISGANVTEAGRAMYNLSQAMSVGAVKLMDWKSIENANMATQEFKETVIETAVAEGTLTKAGDGLYRTLAGSEVSVKNFNQSLQDGWFTSEVLTKTLKKYGEFSDKLNELSVLTGDTATELLQSLDEYEAGTLDLKKVAEETAVPVKDLTEYYEELTSETMALGRKSFQAAQEAKTFKEAIDATKDAVSTGWMNTFEKIFGDYEEAKKLWTRVANELWDVFASGGEARNAILDTWRELEGRENLLQGISNTWEAFKNILQSVKDAFREVFFGTSDEDTLIKNLGQSLADASKRFKEFTERFKTDEFAGKLEKLKTTFKGLFAAVDIVKQILQKAFMAIKPLFGILPGVGDGVLGVTSSIAELLIKLDEFIKTNPKLNGIFSVLSGGFKKVADGVSSGLSKIGSFWDVIKTVFERVKVVVSNAVSVVGGLIEKLTSGLKDAFRSGGIGNALDIANGGILLTIGITIKKFLSTVTKAITGSKFVDKIKEILDSVKGCLESFQKDIQAGTLMKIAKAVALLAASIWILASIDPVRLASALGGLTASFGELLGAMQIFSKIVSKIDKKSTKNMATMVGVMIGLAASVLILSIALKKIGSMETEDVIEGLVGVGALMAGLVIVCQKLSAIEGEIMKGMGSILIFSFALLILSTAVKSLGKLDPASLAKGLIGVTVLLAEMVAVSKIIAGIDSAGMISACFSMILMSVALRLAVSSVKSIADMNPNQLATGLIGVAGLLMLFTGIAGALSKLGKEAAAAIPGAVAMVAMAIALKIAAEPFKELGKMGWDQIAKGAVSMLAIFGVFGGLVAMCAALKVATLAAIPGALAMAAMAIALRIAVGPFQELGNMSWDQIGKGVVGIIGLLGSLGALAALLGVLSPIVLAGSIALAAIGLSFKMATAALSAGIDSIAECIAKMSTINPGEFIATISAISAGISILGVALLAFNPLSLIGATSMLILSEAILKLAPALLLLKVVGPEEIANEMRVLSIGMAEFGLALKAFGPFAGIGSSAMLKLGTAIGTMAPGLALLSLIPGSGVSTTLDTLSQAFVKFGNSLKESPFWGAKSRAEGINALTDGIKKLSESLPTLINDVSPWKMQSTLTAIGEAFVDFGEALKESPFWGTKSRAEGISSLVSSISDLANGLKTFSDLQMTSAIIENRITAIGRGLRSFGEAVKETPLVNTKSNAEGIAALVGSLSDLADGLKALNDLKITSAIIESRMNAIGEIFTVFGSATAYGPMAGAEENAKGIATLISSITSLANGVKAFEEITDLDTASQYMTGIATAMGEFGTALNQAGLNNSDEKAAGIATVVGSIKDLVPAVKELAGLPANKEKISGIFTALGEGMKDIGAAIKKVGGKSEEKATSLSTILDSINALSSAINRLSSMSGTDITAIGTSLGSVIDSIKTSAEGFSGLDITSFTATVSALNKMIPGLQSLTNVNSKAISSNLSAVSTALTSFSTSTSGIAESLVNFSTMGTTAATNFATGYSEAIASATETFTTAGESVISSYTTGVNNKKTQATNAVKGIASACVLAIRGKYTEFNNAGKYVLSGFVSALTSQEALQSVYDAGYKLGEKAEQGTKDATKQSSPSKVFYQRGTYCVTGFVNSFYDGLVSSEIAGKDLAYSAIDGASFALKRASDILDSDLELQPTIRPVIDLSNVQNGVNTLNGIFGAQSLSVNTSTKLSGYTAATMTPNIEVMKRTTGSQNDDVVRAIQTLRSDVNTLSQRFEGLQITIDGKKTVGALTRRIDRSLGKAQVSRKKGV